MAVTKQRTLDYLEQEWGTYVKRFLRLPRDEQEKRIKETGYESFRDMLAHILAWWVEGMEVVAAIADERQFERKKYDFDIFNAEAVARYKTWNEAEFMTHYENTRRKMVADLRSMNETVFENRRVRSWLNGIVILHAREHLVALSRFLSLDMLENEWSTYVENFRRLDAEKQKEFLSKQGVDSFHDMLGHIIGWWEEAARIIQGILGSPGFTWTDPDVDEFNGMLKKKFSSWTEEDLLKHFESVRSALIEIVAKLPEDAFLNRDIEDWLAADLVHHYDDHSVPA
ncbi:MAG TPA: ClbS/DfsB family four-helix bundle protein [Anaerolineales bacterium]|nr:ClbS/DfsB family four-helix bundle protein [Anaerolineales bacterium]